MKLILKKQRVMVEELTMMKMKKWKRREQRLHGLHLLHHEEDLHLWQLHHEEQLLGSLWRLVGDHG